MKENLLIGCGSGFSGDHLDAAGPVLDTLIRRGQPAALMFETLGERTLALAQLARNADPQAGYEPALVRLLDPVLPRAVAHRIPIVGNFGAANPLEAGRVICRRARELGCGAVRVGVVLGDDVRSLVEKGPLEMWEGDSAAILERREVIAANAYLGATPIAEALDKGCDVVVTGRVTDSALALGPLLHHFSWCPHAWDLRAAGVLAGHLLECGAQITGGYYADPGFKDVPDLDRVGFPIAEIDSQGDIIVTKAEATGGCVTERTVKEQLLYEIHDPAAYLTPDVTLDIRGVRVEAIGKDRVRVTGAKGRPPPEQLKVTISYQGDWLGEGEISYAGPNAFRRAHLAASILRSRVGDLLPSERFRTDIIGMMSVFDDDRGTLQAAMAEQADDDRWGKDFRVRLAVHAGERSVAERAVREVLCLYCAGPAGGGGVRQNFSRRLGTVSCLLPRTDVPARVKIVEEG